MLAALAIIGVTKINAVNGSTEIILHDRFVKVSLAHLIENEVNAQLRAIRTALIASDKGVVDKELAKIEASVPVVNDAIQKLTATVHSERGRAALQALVDGRAKFKEHQAPLIEMIKAGKVEDGRTELITGILPVQGVYLHAVEEFARSQTESMEQFGAEAKETAAAAKILTIVLSAVAVGLATLIAVLLSRSITRPIAEALHVAETVASGDLTSEIKSHGRDETGQLLLALHSMNQSLVRIVDQVRLS
ncbi:MCP four helix bundle domain-containing protein, partial [Roseateles sp. P5_E11]